uniref:Uncharacterized protein n=1 Tax=Physcomitrium patens TaxID=3218 RepID=A0A2K1J529_PHYPA|nr:hypothetical protein PHYPA_022490 [Physcomitrium patens]
MVHGGSCRFFDQNPKNRLQSSVRAIVVLNDSLDFVAQSFISETKIESGATPSNPRCLRNHACSVCVHQIGNPSSGVANFDGELTLSAKAVRRKDDCLGMCPCRCSTAQQPSFLPILHK